MKYKAIGENHLYQKAYARGEKAVAKTVVVYVLRDYAAARLQKAHPQKKRENRVGLTVTKKLGGAVVRNRVKRILREGLRQLDRESPLKRGFLVVIVARDAAVQAGTPEILSDLRAAMRKLRMIEGMPYQGQGEGTRKPERNRKKSACHTSQQPKSMPKPKPAQNTKSTPNAEPAQRAEPVQRAEPTHNMQK